MKESIVQYDKLYKVKGILWTETPGRMVVEAISHFKKPGKCLDMGCGDGKNMIFLERRGWKVNGIDKSTLAIKGAKKRFHINNQIIKGSLKVQNVTSYKYPSDYYDLVVCYGLYHCLKDSEIKTIHHKMINSLKSGGLIAFCMINDNLPMPFNHGTTKIFLRSENYIKELVNDYIEILKVCTGEIEEDHLPVIGKHKHSITWCLFKKK
jgi:2-polyprenyl-3-methyl-5-hydroxy-6-metoxy-1,4-benzoquinol methylase